VTTVSVGWLPVLLAVSVAVVFGASVVVGTTVEWAVGLCVGVMYVPLLMIVPFVLAEAREERKSRIRTVNRAYGRVVVRRAIFGIGVARSF